MSLPPQKFAYHSCGYFLCISLILLHVTYIYKISADKFYEVVINVYANELLLEKTSLIIFVHCGPA
jgi:hypothetical protein